MSPLKMSFIHGSLCASSAISPKTGQWYLVEHHETARLSFFCKAAVGSLIKAKQKRKKRMDLGLAVTVLNVQGVFLK